MSQPLTEFEAIQYIDALKEMIQTNDFDFSFLQAKIDFREIELEGYIRQHNTSSLKNPILSALNKLSENGQSEPSELDENNETIKLELLYQYRELLIDTLIETIKGSDKTNE